MNVRAFPRLSGLEEGAAVNSEGQFQHTGREPADLQRRVKAQGVCATGLPAGGSLPCCSEPSRLQVWPAALRR